MQSPQDDAIERLIRKALAPSDAIHAPEGFPGRVESRLYFLRLLEQQRLRTRRAWAAGLGGLVGLTGATVLFARAVDVPAWVVENVPGVLGRLDAATVRLDSAAAPFLLAGAGALVSAMVWAALRWRSRRLRAGV